MRINNFALFTCLFTVQSDFTLLSIAVAVKRIGMRKRWGSLLTAAVTISILAPLSTTARINSAYVDTIGNSSAQSEVPASRLVRLRHGINLSHWFAQSSDYSRAHPESHTTAEDIALISSIGFDHVRFALEPPPFFNE